MRVGVSILLAEKGDLDYDNKLNLWRRMHKYKETAERSLQKVEHLINELNKREGIKPLEPFKTEKEEEFDEEIEKLIPKEES